MTRRLPAAWLVPVLLGPAWTCAAGETGAEPEEAYRDEHIAAHTAISTAGSGTLRLGDVFSLVVTVSFDEEAVAIHATEGVRVTDGRPGESGLVVLGSESSQQPGPTGSAVVHQTRLRFQVLGCPDGAPTCRGRRQYVLPELTVNYRVRGADAPVTVSFPPEPRLLSVASALAADEDGGLRPFSTYFPEGAYPPAATAPDRTRTSLAAAGTGLLLLIGGTLMWPFRLRGNSDRPAELSRWRALLHEIEQDDEADHFRLAERMRRCLVWYCSDELRLDPFDWIETPESGERPHEHGELRALFVDLLHDPAGRSAELRSRLVLLLPSARKRQLPA